MGAGVSLGGLVSVFFVLACLGGLSLGCRPVVETPRAVPDVESVRGLDPAPGVSEGGAAERPVPGVGMGSFVVTPWPTFTPVPTPGPSVVPVGVAGVEEAASFGVSGGDAASGSGLDGTVGKRVTCLAAFRAWLVETDWSTARDLGYALDGFRVMRPDCSDRKFSFDLSSRPYCRDQDRVGGVRVPGSFSRGEAYNHNLQLLGTRKTSDGYMIVHFSRAPGSLLAGCWYYDGGSGVWVGATVDGYGKPVLSTPEPTVAAVSAVARICDDALRRRFAGDPGPAAGADLQAVVEQVSTGLAECSVGWSPFVFEVRVAEACPLVDSHRGADGSVVVHWSDKPGDGASCWMYDPATGEWESR